MKLSGTVQIPISVQITSCFWHSNPKPNILRKYHTEHEDVLKNVEILFHSLCIWWTLLFPHQRIWKTHPLPEISCERWTCFMLRLILSPLAHGYIHKTYISAETMSCYHAHLEGFLLTVSAHNTHLPPTPSCYSPREQVNMHCSPSDALGRCVRLVLVLQQWPHIHAGSVKTASFIAEQVIGIKEGMIWKWICNIELQRVKQHSSWINLPKRVCWIFQWDCEVVSLNTRSCLRFGNPEGFLQQSLSCSFY